MPNLSVKDVPEAWAEALRQRAARHHRSLQGELMAILQQAVEAVPAEPRVLYVAEPAPGATPPAIARTTTAGVVRLGTKTIEEIGAELDAKFPKPFVGGPLGRDIIRAERDAR